jgi:hypothetical protein
MSGTDTWPGSGRSCRRGGRGGHARSATTSAAACRCGGEQERAAAAAAPGRDGRHDLLRLCPRARRRHPPQSPAAQFWPDNERAILVAATVRATEFGCPGHATGLALYCFVMGNLGITNLYQGRFQDAACAHGQALNISRGTSDRAGEIRALCNLGVVEERMSRCQQAVSGQKPSLIIAREIGARGTEYPALLRLGIARLRRRSWTQARGRPPARSGPVLRDRPPSL